MKIKKTVMSAVAAVALLTTCMTAHSAGAIVGARIDGGFQYYWAISKPSKKIATAEAMKECKGSTKADKHTGKCELILSKDGPAYFAIFHAYNGSIGYGYSQDRQEAIDMAYQECIKKGECPNNAAHVLSDEGQVAKVAAASQQNCSAPAGKVLRYRDSCRNGDCVRTYENGCTKQFQAPHCFDPVKQAWEWKPDGC